MMPERRRPRLPNRRESSGLEPCAHKAVSLSGDTAAMGGGGNLGGMIRALMLRQAAGRELEVQHENLDV